MHHDLFEIIEVLSFGFLALGSIVGTILIALEIRLEKTLEKGKYNLVYCWEGRTFVRQFSMKLNFKRKH
jgi:hypothetical protein